MKFDNLFFKKILIFKKILCSQNIVALSIIFYKFLEYFLYVFDYVFTIFDRNIEYKHLNPKIIFIVGSHRSGSTYIAETLNQYMDTYPLSNFNNLFKKSFLIHKFFVNKNKNKNKRKNFYGQNNGLFNINDNHQIWDQWLGGNHEYSENLTNIQKDQICNYFKKLYSINKKTIISKSGRNLFIINDLLEIFPNSIAIIVNRNLNNIIKSTKNANKYFFDNRFYWGLKTKSFYEHQINTTNEKELVNFQCLEISHLIKKTLSAHHIDRKISINYEDFIDNKKDISFLNLRNELDVFFKKF